MTITKVMAAKANCRASAEARQLKAAQLEREIHESAATPAQKANMQHTLSKLGIFAQDERDQLTRLGTSHVTYSKWLKDFDA